MLKNKIVSLFHVVLLLIVSTSAFAADTVKLAENGKALATIEIAPEASIAMRSVANEMADYLLRMSGARFQVANSTGTGTRIVLGRNSDFSGYKLGDRLRGNGQEAFVMRTTGDRVLLLGVTDEAASHAAYTFLEKLGVRWFFPTPEWEIVPSSKTLTASFDEVQSPDISLHRDIWYGSMTGYTVPNHLRLDWMRRNRMKTDGPNTSHSWIGLDPDKDFKEHPEWFALVKGERRNSKPNYGHPEVIQRAIASSLAAAERGAKSISVSAPDGLGFCECDQCLKVAGVTRDSVYIHNGAIFGKRPDGTDVCITSETIFRMANAVAVEVGKKYPNVLIGVFAYSGYAHPPSFDLEPNIYVAVTSLYRRTPLSFDEQIKIYGDKSKQLGIYDYYHIAVFYGWHPSKGLKMSDLAERIPFYHANKVLGINAEGTNNWLPAGLDFYVSSKLMWDVKTNVDAVYADFLDKAFGKARGPMKSYYDRWESKAELNPATIGGALDDLITAYRMADNDAAKTRIAQLYLYNRFIHLGMIRAEAAKDDPAKAEQAGEEYANLFWRLKDTLLLHDLVTGGVNRPLVPGFTAKELDALMDEDAAWIKENRNLFLTYSRNLVPISTAGKAIPGLQEQPVALGDARRLQFIVPAKSGEQVEVELKPGSKAVPYQVTFMTPELFRSAAGASLAEAVTKGEADDKISFKAAKTGYYRIITSGSNVVGLNRPHAMDGSEQQFNSATLYFYVPKGTKEFTVYAAAHGSPTVTVRDHTGNIVFEQKGFAAGARGEELSGSLKSIVKVPNGADGAIWSVTGPGNVNRTSGIGLSGVPEYLSLTPQQLLVAEEYLK
jgi:hypothetical protein